MGSKGILIGPAILQNCDLPLPLKVFVGPNQAMFSPVKIREDDESESQLYGFPNEKLQLLKALRHSQTRAREAERKAASLIKERDMISNALMGESTRLYAYRQWVRLLEIQVSKLQNREEEKENDSEGVGSITWIVALAFCFGISGVGFVFGCRSLI